MIAFPIGSFSDCALFLLHLFSFFLIKLVVVAYEAGNSSAVSRGLMDKAFISASSPFFFS